MIGKIEFGPLDSIPMPVIPLNPETVLLPSLAVDQGTLNQWDGTRYGFQARKDKYYLRIVKAVASGSKCPRAKTGCLIVGPNGNIVGTGYNGHPMGSNNDDECYREGLIANSQKENCCLHCEANAIIFSKHEDRIGGTMYLSGVPCADCSLLIMQCGVVRLVYVDLFKEGQPGCGNGGVPMFEKYGSKIEVDVYKPEEIA